MNDDLRPTIQYSDAAVIRLIDKVRQSVERPATDARVKIDGAGVDTLPGVEGLAVSASQLHRQIGAGDDVDDGAAHLRRQDAPHPAEGHQAADLKRQYDTVIVVNRSQFRLRLFKALKPTQTYGIAVGQVGLETPAGQYTIANKAINPAWHVPDSAWAGKLAGKVIPGDDPTNPIKARWLGILDGVGIHGTSDDASIGHNASHGCIRMHIPDVERLYDEVPVGSAVYIA
jgi:lipoprotein-anchoring transpeptidase ErfK/SrfK